MIIVLSDFIKSQSTEKDVAILNCFKLGCRSAFDFAQVAFDFAQVAFDSAQDGKYLNIEV
jgi:hypothetical protein